MGEPMNLKKSDKIIAIIGVIILIVAGIGIVLYSAEEGPDKKGMGTKETTFEVKWVQYSDGIMTINDYAGKKQPYTDPITISLEEGCVLTTVEVQIVWNDDYTKGLIFNKGEDKLEATIGLAGEEYVQTHKSTKKANATLDPFIINDVPQDETIEDAEGIYDMEDKILNDYLGMNTATFDVKVTVTPGEKLLTLRPIKLLNYLRDKGNKFDLIVKYEYYELDVEEVEKNNPSTPTGARVGAGVYTTTNFAFSKL